MEHILRAVDRRGSLDGYISPDEEIDLDKIRKDIKKDIINAVTEELRRH